MPSQRSTVRRPPLAAYLLVFGLIVANLPSSAAGATDCAAIASADLRRICERGELRVARYGGERPPFFSRTDGSWNGFDVDLARDIAARLGVRYSEDASASSFDEVVERVVSGEADIAVSKLSATLDRAFKVRFTRPYLTVYQAVLVNRLSVPSGRDPFAALDARGVVVGALDGTAYMGYAAATFGRSEIRGFASFEQMMEQVVSGGIDAALMDSARANSWRQANRRQLIHVRTTVDKSRRDPLAIAVGWQDTHLLAWLDLYLDTIRADGTARRLYRKWFAAADSAEEAGSP